MLSDAHNLGRVTCFSDGAVEKWICLRRDLSRFGSIQGIHVLDIQYKFLVFESPDPPVEARHVAPKGSNVWLKIAGVDFWYNYGQTPGVLQFWLKQTSDQRIRLFVTECGCG